jgi:hypothetical protein
MKSFLAEIWSVYRNLSHESKKISLHQLDSVAPDIQVGIAEGQHWQIAKFDFEGYDFHALPYFIFLP